MATVIPAVCDEAAEERFVQTEQPTQAAPEPAQTQRFLQVGISRNALGQATDRQALEAAIIETAYEAYARGSGDVLGPATVRYEPALDMYMLHYALSNSSTVNPNWVIDWGATSANISISEWQADGSIVFENWLPGGQTNRAEFTPVWPEPVLSPEQAKRLEVINKKAQELLLQHLTEGQRKTWLAEQYFDMLAPSGRRYRLRHGHYHNVFLLDDHGRAIREYCAYSADPGGKLPAEDNVFAQLMALKFDERSFLAVANTWDLLRNRLFVGQGVDADLPQLELAA